VVVIVVAKEPTEAVIVLPVLQQVAEAKKNLGANANRVIVEVVQAQVVATAKAAVTRKDINL
jgi:hypothetical protein